MWQGLTRGEQAALHQAAPPRAFYPIQGRYSSRLHKGGSPLTRLRVAIRTAWDGDVQDRHARARALVDQHGALHNGSRRCQWSVSYPTVATFSCISDIPLEKLSRPRGAVRLRTFRSDQPRGADRQGSLHELCAFPGRGALSPPFISSPTAYPTSALPLSSGAASTTTR
jgi:hypothetical protein